MGFFSSLILAFEFAALHLITSLHDTLAAHHHIATPKSTFSTISSTSIYSSRLARTITLVNDSRDNGLSSASDDSETKINDSCKGTQQIYR